MRSVLPDQSGIGDPAAQQRAWRQPAHPHRLRALAPVLHAFRALQELYASCCRAPWPWQQWHIAPLESSHLQGQGGHLCENFWPGRRHSPLPDRSALQVYVQHSAAALEVGSAYGAISGLWIRSADLKALRPLFPWRHCAALLRRIRNRCNHLSKGGFSTHAHFPMQANPNQLHSLQALSDEANELLPIFNKTSSKFYRATVPTGDWSNQVKYAKKKKTSAVSQ